MNEPIRVTLSALAGLSLIAGGYALAHLVAAWRWHRAAAARRRAAMHELTPHGIYVVQLKASREAADAKPYQWRN